jgi:hypothetical protein
MVAVAGFLKLLGFFQRGLWFVAMSPLTLQNLLVGSQIAGFGLMEFVSRHYRNSVAPVANGNCAKLEQWVFIAVICLIRPLAVARVPACNCPLACLGDAGLVDCGG